MGVSILEKIRSETVSMLGTDRDIDIFDSAATRELNLAKKTTNAAANIWFFGVSLSESEQRRLCYQVSSTVNNQAYIHRLRN